MAKTLAGMTLLDWAQLSCVHHVVDTGEAHEGTDHWLLPAAR